MSRTKSDRTTALKLLNHFRRRILPGALRRIAAWKGIPSVQLRDWLDDVLQELAVDCLEHAKDIVNMPDRQRHARWMRQTEKVIYRHRRQQATQYLAVEEPARPTFRQMTDCDLQLPPLVTLGNGRSNVDASIRMTGIPRRDFRRRLDRLAEQLGWNGERQTFWQSRVAEALTGLAADLLMTQGTLRLLEQPPEVPDIERRATRLRLLCGRFPVQPSTRLARKILRPWIRRGNETRYAPRTLLDQAVALDPQSGAAWLWLFEACCSERDAFGALTALRCSRRCRDAPRSAIVLARARVLELRGHFAAAIALLRRAAKRWPRESAYQQALAIAGTSAA